MRPSRSHPVRPNASGTLSSVEQDRRTWKIREYAIHSIDEYDDPIYATRLDLVSEAGHRSQPMQARVSDSLAGLRRPVTAHRPDNLNP